MLWCYQFLFEKEKKESKRNILNIVFKYTTTILIFDDDQKIHFFQEDNGTDVLSKFVESLPQPYLKNNVASSFLDVTAVTVNIQVILEPLSDVVILQKS